MKFKEIFLFEIYYQVRRPSTWIFFIAVQALIFLVLDEFVDYTARTGGEMLINSPLSIAEMTGYANKFGLLLIMALAGNGAMRDIQTRMDPLVFTTPVDKGSYLGGRFFGTFIIASILMLLIVPFCMFITSQTGNAKYMGPFIPLGYINSSLFITIPNVFISTALIYWFVLTFRHTMGAYVGGLVLFVLSTFTLDIAGSWFLGKIIDPFGTVIITDLSRSLGAQQLNTKLVGFSGFLLSNRFTWIGISVLAGFIAYYRFNITHNTQKKTKKKEEKNIYDDFQNTEVLTAEKGNKSEKNAFDLKTYIYKALSISKFTFQNIIWSPLGLAMPTLAIYAFILIPDFLMGPMDIPGIATTERISMMMGNSFISIFIILFITLMVGEVVWQERDMRLNEVSDALPVTSGLIISGKFMGIVFVLVTLHIVLILTAVLLQFSQESSPVNIAYYIQMITGFQLLEYITFAAVALAFHILINQKYVGHMAVLLFYLFTTMPRLIGIEHKLLIFGSDIGLATSIFYSQSEFLLPWILFKLYWIGWAFLLILIARYMWIRGKETGFSSRLKRLINGLRCSPGLLIGALIVIISTGSVIFYNTNILNSYSTSADRILKQVEYERQNGQFKSTPQPVLTGNSMKIEIFPEKRECVIKGIYILKNEYHLNIDSIHIGLSNDVNSENLSFDRNAELILSDKNLHHEIFLLENPLEPGESLKLSYQVTFIPSGFSNHGINTSVMNNGTYFHNLDWLPSIGYQKSRELKDNRKRSEYGLPKNPVYNSLYDSVAIMDQSGKELINFEAIIGTSDEQIAITSGTLVKHWQENGRNYFHYIADKPIRNMYHVYSAEYKVRESFQGDIDFKIYYHPMNIQNLESIEKGMHASLKYYSEKFAPYQFRQLSFVEYPDPGTGGISLPGTIGYSTNFALLNSKKDPRGFDQHFAVAAHEVAHQWWGHQLSPANVAGAIFLTEGLAWYSAIQVIEDYHDQEHLQNFLNAMRLEFLIPRTKAARPLLESNDEFQGKRKAPLAMYALQEYIGKDSVNKALRNLLSKFNSPDPHYSTSFDLYKELKAVTPDSLKYFLKDLFEINTFWHLSAKKAIVRTTEDGQWLVDLEVYAAKSQVDTAGTEKNIPMNDLIEIGIFRPGNESMHRPIYLQKHRIHSGKNQLQLKVRDKPGKAAIDPRNLLIDIEMDDNIMDVT